MESIKEINNKLRILKVDYNMYTSTYKIIPEKKFDIDISQNWSEIIDDGLQGMKRAEF
jgi:hypothetical protein